MDDHAAALIDHHNSIVRRAMVRARELESRMEKVLTPVFDRAGADAAESFTTYAARATLIASAEVQSSSTMIALKPTAEQAAALAEGGSEPADSIHCTLVYIGETDADLDTLASALAKVAASHAPLSGEIAGIASFSDNGNGAPSIVLPDVRGLVELRVEVTQALMDAGFDYSRNHGYEAHMTLDYTDSPQPPDEALLGLPLDFAELWVVRGDVETRHLPFTGALPLTAGSPAPDLSGIEAEIAAVAEAHAPDGGYGDTSWSESTATVFWVAADWTSNGEWEAAEAAFLAIEGVESFESEAEVPVPNDDEWKIVYSSSALRASGEPTIDLTWVPPLPDLLVDLDALTEELAAAMDPVTQRAIETVVRTSLETAPLPSKPEPSTISIAAAGRRRKAPDYGISYDATNPYVAQLLARDTSQIRDIARGTQRKIAAVVAQGYANGDSIPKVAEAIRSTTRRLAPARATLIARTELAGAVNGGSLAATSILDEAFGGLGISKVWLTAPGAPHPRHELYEGLNGQTQPLALPFDVGGQQLMFPGDPAGDPSEVCNCRCAISYTKSGQEIAQASADEALDPETIAAEAADGEGEVALGAEQAVGDVVAAEAPQAEKVVADQAIHHDDLPAITQDVRIAKAKDPEHPHAHLQNSSLNAYISLYRRQMRELLAKPRLTDAQTKDMQTLQNALTDALKERESRGGGGIVPARPFAHLSDPQLERSLERAEQSLSEMPKRLAAQRAARAEVQSKIDAMRAEVTYRAKRPPRTRAAKAPAVEPLAPALPGEPTILRAGPGTKAVAQPSRGKSVRLVVKPREGGRGYVLHGSYESSSGRSVSWESEVFKRKSEAEAARQQHLLGYSADRQQDFVLSRLPRDDPKNALTIDELASKGRDLGYFDPAGKPTRAAEDALYQLKAKGLVERTSDNRWYATSAQTPYNAPGGVYKPPVPAKNQRMQRLQDVYAQRFGYYRETQHGMVLSKDPRDIQPSVAETKAAGADFRAEVAARTKSVLSRMGYPERNRFARNRYGTSKVRRDAILQVLSEIRPVGSLDSLQGVSLGSDPLASNWLRNAGSFYPADWVKMIGDARIDVTRTEERSGVAAYGEQNRYAVRLNGERRNAAYEAQVGERVGIHEIAHILEKSVDGLALAEREFYASRCEGERLVQRAGDSRSFVRRDDFVTDYMGRDYVNVGPGSVRMPTGNSFELLSCGWESLMTGNFAVWEGDPDMVNWLLGLVVSL